MEAKKEEQEESDDVSVFLTKLLCNMFNKKLDSDYH
jgi:hypothetical protein